jgi:hypothetical protein
MMHLTFHYTTDAVRDVSLLLFVDVIVDVVVVDDVVCDGNEHDGDGG